jgi:mono/diheme cytochrome c family protein
MNRALRRSALASALLAALLGTALALATWAAEARLARKFETHRVEIPVPYPLDERELSEFAAQFREPDGAARVAVIARERALKRGEHLTRARYGCTNCHGDDLAGGVMVDNVALGMIQAPNLTNGFGGRVARYTMSDWDRLVRHGVKPNGTPAVMPADDYRAMTDRELSDIVLYIRSRPPVSAEVPAPRFGPVARLIIALGRFRLTAETFPDHMGTHPKVPPDVTDPVAFGAHMAQVCRGCHRDNLAGGPMPFGPPTWPSAANLTQHEQGLRGWSYADFDRAMTQGISKGGRPLRAPMTMVLAQGRALTEAERQALWGYLTRLEPRATNE